MSNLETTSLIHEDEAFSKLDGISALAEKLITRRKRTIFLLVYLLVKLAIILSITTTTVEKAFSALNIIKTSLCNQLGDEFTNDYLVTYIERDVFTYVFSRRNVVAFLSFTEF